MNTITQHRETTFTTSHENSQPWEKENLLAVAATKPTTKTHRTQTLSIAKLFVVLNRMLPVAGFVFFTILWVAAADAMQRVACNSLMVFFLLLYFKNFT